MADLPKKPASTTEAYLAMIAGEAVEPMPEPKSNIDRYLKHIAENSGTGGGGTSGVSSFNGRKGAVAPQKDDYSAADIGYDNAQSGLTADNMQNAIDEIAQKGGVAAGVSSFNGRTGHVVSLPGDYDNFFCYPLYAYDGVNIKEKFAGEMETTEPWVWLQQRLAAQDISGLHIKDYFELIVKDNSSNDVTLQMQIAGINHNLYFWDTNKEITDFHIDFISKDLWPEQHVWNKVNYNNGLSTCNHPWYCSDLFAWLNSKSMKVPNSATDNTVTVNVDYTSTGVYDKFPATLHGVIADRKIVDSSRYSGDGIISDDNSVYYVGVNNLPELFIPNETEVYGQCAFGTSGYSVADSHRYPIFTDPKMRIKRVNGERKSWWLRNASGSSSREVACVHLGGTAVRVNTSGTAIYVPVCFRISG